ncbi:MAG: LysR family transcriptional regulator [Hyphomicrobiales bacterium]|nr:LysR family transcriptional regulator [Hyphomicrobiales bacterium]
MDTRFLASFVEVVEHGSLAEAARRLNLTPAAVAQRVHALEAEFGVALIARSGRIVRPTEAGIAILERSRRFLREVRDLKSYAVESGIAGELRLGAISTALTGLVPRMLEDFLRRHPELEIYLEPSTSMELYRKIGDGELDLAIMIAPPFAVPKPYAVHVIREEPLIMIAPAAWSAEDPLRLLATQPLVRYDRKQWGGRLVDDFLRQHRIRPAERFELDSLEAIAVMVDRGLGVALVPDWARPWPEGLALRKIVLPAPGVSRQICMFWLKSSPRIRLVQAFVNAYELPGEAVTPAPAADVEPEPTPP